MEITLISAALVLGFTTGFHCLGMCGPIALSLGLSKKQQVNYHLQNIT
jgi:sulfite exporter TauE/SafE